MSQDKEIFDLIQKEFERQMWGLELIASENYTSSQIRSACGSILTNKYAEGYPSKRYYGGCENIDKIEQIAIDRACELFKCKYANVQPHSGSQANMAAYKALLNYGDTILAPNLLSGGHLTHSSSVSFVSKLYNIVTYDVDSEGKLDYNRIEKLANKYKPKLILTGFSAYPYIIDFKKLSDIAKSINAYFMVDMAHIAGIVAAGYCVNPCNYADVVTTTTHKTLRGPRGGLILTNNENLITKINKAIFPYYQGGPLEHIIAGKAICFKEAMEDSFGEYIHNVLINTKACRDRLSSLGDVVSDTDNHLFLLNTYKSYNITGKDAQAKLESIGITTNKNMLPNDSFKPTETSGLRIGFAALTTRNCNKSQAIHIADIIHQFLNGTLSYENAKFNVTKIATELKCIKQI